MSDTIAEAKVRKIVDRIRAATQADTTMASIVRLEGDYFTLVVSDDIWSVLIEGTDVRYNGGRYPITIKWIDSMPHMRIWGIATTVSKDLIGDEIRFRAELEV